MKRGQSALEQPFIYIFGLIVIAFIFIFGYYLISRTTKLESNVEITDTLTKLNEQVGHYYNLDPGSSGVVNLNIPQSIQYVCFAASMGTAGFNTIPFSNQVGVGIKNGKNVFLIPFSSQDTVQPYFIDKIQFNDPTCFLNKGNQISMKMENKGNYIQISKP